MNKRKRLLLLLCCPLFLIGAGLYFFWPKPQYAKIPVYYKASSDIPVVDLEIESKKYVMELDSGAQHYIALQKRCLDQIMDKADVGTGTYYDLHGNSYERPAFRVPKIQIKNFKVYPINITQEDPNYLTNGGYVIIKDLESVQKAIDEIDGRIGIYIFQSFCLLLDLPHSLVYISKDQEALREEISFDEFIEVPLLSDEWPVLAIDTEYGSKKALLDTGCSCSLWRDEEKEQLLPVSVNHLYLDSIDFGSHEFAVFPFTEKTEVDVILGVDFLKKHTVFIDLKNKRALISPKIP